jgi:hypothetical protein
VEIEHDIRAGMHGWRSTISALRGMVEGVPSDLHAPEGRAKP